MNNALPSRQTAHRSIGFKSTDRLRRAIALLIAVTSLNLSPALLPDVFATPHSGAAVATGMMRVAGTVTIDGERATSGQTIFTGNYIATAAGSESIIDLGRFTRFLLSAETEFTLEFSSMSISGSLSKGVVRGFIPAGIPLNLRTAGAELLTDSSQPAAFIVQVDGDNTKVSVETGRVEMRIGNRVQAVGVGQVFTTASGSPAQPVPSSNLTNRQRVGLFAAIGTAAAILLVAIIGRDEEEPQFGGCVIVPSGRTEQSGICP